jgi:hypothetical protein
MINSSSGRASGEQQQLLQQMRNPTWVKLNHCYLLNEW